MRGPWGLVGWGGVGMGAWQEAEMNKRRSCTKDTSLVGEQPLAHHSPRYRFTAQAGWRGWDGSTGQSTSDETGREAMGQRCGWPALHNWRGPGMPSLSAPSETEPAVQPACRSAHRQPAEPLSQRVHLPGRQGGTCGHSVQGASLGSLQTLLSFRLPTLWLAGVRPGNQVGKESPLLRRRAQRPDPPILWRRKPRFRRETCLTPASQQVYGWG